MKKKPVKIDPANMTGFGPAAWDRDESRLSIHLAHEEHAEHHHMVHRTRKHAAVEGKPETAHKDGTKHRQG